MELALRKQSLGLFIHTQVQRGPEEGARAVYHRRSYNELAAVCRCDRQNGPESVMEVLSFGVTIWWCAEITYACLTDNLSLKITVTKFAKSKVKKNGFKVNHFAGFVEYKNIDGVLFRALQTGISCKY